jgi:SulP family sulfate permease
MQSAQLARQVSAGVLVGLSAVIYSISYGAFLFSGPLSGLVGFGITAALITAITGALFGLMSEEGSFISGPDSNTISVMVGMLAVFGSMGLPEDATLGLAVAALFTTSLVCITVFVIVAKLNLAELVRYIPFSVMAGFLAATGWLMASGALNIIAGTPLSIAGLEALREDPARPELLFSFVVVGVLYAFAPRVSSGVLIPVVMFVATLLVNLFLGSHACNAAMCSPQRWLFPSLQDTQWMPPWELLADLPDPQLLLQQLPTMLVVSFVGLLTILLSIASLELNYRREFDLNQMLKAHAATTVFTAFWGGFVGIISIGRTTLNYQAGGGKVSGVVAALMCIAMLFGAGSLIAYVPKAALGGLILYLGLNMLKQWLWQQRQAVSREELAQILLILVLVANYGYVVGFAAGVVISCAIFIITYSDIPLTNLTTDLSLFSSSVVRPQHQVEILKTHGQATRLYRLSGYVFFGSASRIDAVFKKLDIDTIDGVIIDFSKVTGIDTAAIGVFQRILRRYHGSALHFHFVHAPGNMQSVVAISKDPTASKLVTYYPALDLAVEAAENLLIAQHPQEVVSNDCFAFLGGIGDRKLFRSYCELRHVARGELLCRDGDFSNEVYFIEDGSLETLKTANDGARLRLSKLAQGAMVGEIAFYTGSARTAAIEAVMDSQIHVLTQAGLAKMRIHHPGLATRFDQMVIRRMAAALTRTNRLIATLD